MGIFVIAGTLLALVGLAGLIAVFAIPGWRPRGPRKTGALIRVGVFALCLVVGVAILAYGAMSGTTIRG